MTVSSLFGFRSTCFFEVSKMCAAYVYNYKKEEMNQPVVNFLRTFFQGEMRKNGIDNGKIEKAYYI